MECVSLRIYTRYKVAHSFAVMKYAGVPFRVQRAIIKYLCQLEIFLIVIKNDFARLENNIHIRRFIQIFAFF